MLQRWVVESGEPWLRNVWILTPLFVCVCVCVQIDIEKKEKGFSMYVNGANSPRRYKLNQRNEPPTILPGCKFTAHFCARFSDLALPLNGITEYDQWCVITGIAFFFKKNLNSLFLLRSHFHQGKTLLNPNPFKAKGKNCHYKLFSFRFKSLTSVPLFRSQLGCDG